MCVCTVSIHVYIYAHTCTYGTYIYNICVCVCICLINPVSPKAPNLKRKLTQTCRFRSSEAEDLGSSPN